MAYTYKVKAPIFYKSTLYRPGKRDVLVSDEELDYKQLELIEGEKAVKVAKKRAAKKAAPSPTQAVSNPPSGGGGVKAAIQDIEFED